MLNISVGVGAQKSGLVVQKGAKMVQNSETFKS
jgi:hypothetical protein